jgi:hypothetical protein
VRVKRAVREAGSLHYFAHGYILKSSFPEEAGSLLHDPFMFGGGLFGGVAHFFPHPPSMMIII